MTKLLKVPTLLPAAFLTLALVPGCKHVAPGTDAGMKDDENSNVPGTDFRELETKPPHLSNGRIDVTHYDVSLTFKSMTAQDVSARAEITLKLLKADRFVRLHTEKSTVQVLKASVISGNQTTPANFSVIDGVAGHHYLSGSVLKIQLPREAAEGTEVKLALEYVIKPQSETSDRGLVFKTSFEHEPIFNTRNWPYYARFWLPGNDNPADTSTFHIELAVPPDTVGASNGELSGNDYKNGSGVKADRLRHFVWNMATPIPTYSVNVTVGKLDVIKEDICFDPAHRLSGDQISCDHAAAKVPFVYYIQSHHSQRDLFLKQAHEGVRQMILMSSILGVYPYPKLGFVTAPHPFNMESTSMITMISPEATTHEVAHHWWGNTVYIEDWGDLWISEGFTTYFEGFYSEIFKDKYSGCSQTRGTLNNPKDTDPLEVFNNTPYCKGAAAIADLRKSIETLAADAGQRDKGRDAFLTVTRRLFETYKFKRLGSESLVKYLRAHTKESLGLLNIVTSQAAVDRAITDWQGKWL